MAMNLWSKNTKTSSGTSDVISGESNVTNATPNPETVVTDSPPHDNQSEVTDNRLAKIAEVQEGWRKMVYAEFHTGAHIPWDSFRKGFKKIKWSGKYLDEGSGTQVSSNIILQV